MADRRVGDIKDYNAWDLVAVSAGSLLTGLLLGVILQKKKDEKEAKK